MPIYRGVGGANREIKQIYRGINGVNRKVQRQYRGIGGTNKVVFRDGYGLDEIAQVVFKVYNTSAVSLNDNATYNNLEMRLVTSNINGNLVTGYYFRVPLGESIVLIPCLSIQISGEYKIQFLDGEEFPLNHQTLTEILPITTMTVKYCMGAFSGGKINASEMTGKLQVLDQVCTTAAEFPELNHTGLILKKSVSYINEYPQSSLANLAVYANAEKTRCPTSLDWFTDWLGETHLNHIFLQKGQYTYESDIAIVDARN